MAVDYVLLLRIFHSIAPTLSSLLCVAFGAFSWYRRRQVRLGRRPPSKAILLPMFEPVVLLLALLFAFNFSFSWASFANGSDVNTGKYATVMVVGSEGINCFQLWFPMVFMTTNLSRPALVRSFALALAISAVDITFLLLVTSYKFHVAPLLFGRAAGYMLFYVAVCVGWPWLRQRRSSVIPFAVACVLCWLSTSVASLLQWYVADDPHHAKYNDVLTGLNYSALVIFPFLHPVGVMWTLRLDTEYWRGTVRRKGSSAGRGVFSRPSKLYALASTLTGSSGGGGSINSGDESGIGRSAGRSSSSSNSNSNSNNSADSGRSSGGGGGGGPSPMMRTRSASQVPTVLDDAAFGLQNVLEAQRGHVLDFSYLYVSRRRLGEGGSANVFAGTFAGQPVAVKVWSPQAVTARVVERYMHEAEMTLSLQHPSVVRFHGLVVVPPDLCYVFERARCSLFDAIHDPAEWPAWSVLDMFDFAFQATQGVTFMHSFDPPYIHRDIKSLNYLFFDDVGGANQKLVKLSDFGSARPRGDLVESDDGDRVSLTSRAAEAAAAGAGTAATDREAASATATTPLLSTSRGDGGDGGNGNVRAAKRTSSRSVGADTVVSPSARYASVLSDTSAQSKGSAQSSESSSSRYAQMTEGVGSLLWSAPEVVRAEPLYSEKVDIYSLAVVINEIFTGEEPFRGVSVWDVKRGVVAGQRPATVDAAQCPAGLRELLEAAWHAEPESRPEAAEVARRLLQLRAEHAERGGPRWTVPAQPVDAASRAAGGGDGGACASVPKAPSSFGSHRASTSGIV